MQNTLIIGATSAIAEATARLFANRGDSLFLLARDRERLAAISQDLKVRGAARVECSDLDLGELSAHKALIDSAFDSLGAVDNVLIAHGTLPDQQACERDFPTALNEIHINAISTVSLLTHLANRLEEQGSGTLAVVTSVAGDRGRQSNYVYGASKSMVSVFLQGLRNRLYRSGVAVLDIKPGFVDTPMTRAFEKGPLWVRPEAVARNIYAAMARKTHTLYTPFFWRFIMLVIRNIPEALFKRARL
jgi:short-subunit dehydrogenase